MGRSQRIRFREARAMLHLCTELVEMRALSEPWKLHALKGIAGLVPAKALFFCQFADFTAGRLPSVRDAAMHGWVDADGQAVMAEALQHPEGVFDAHPFMKALAHVRGRCFTHRRVELVDDATWYRSEAFNKAFRPCGLDDNLGSVCRHEPTKTAYGFGLHRDRDDQRFTRRDRMILHLILEAVEPVFNRSATAEERATNGLSPRLQQTLDCLLAGDSEKQIARRIHLSPHTVHDYVKALYRHFDVSSRAELMVACLDPARLEGN